MLIAGIDTETVTALQIQAMGKRVGSFLRLYRASADMSQSALARAMEVSATVICNWENGRHAPNATMAARLAHGLRGAAPRQSDADTDEPTEEVAEYQHPVWMSVRAMEHENGRLRRENERLSERLRAITAAISNLR